MHPFLILTHLTMARALSPVQHKNAWEPIKSALEPIKSAWEPIKNALEPINSAWEPIKNA